MKYTYAYSPKQLKAAAKKVWKDNPFFFPKLNNRKEVETFLLKQVEQTLKENNKRPKKKQIFSVSTLGVLFLFDISEEKGHQHTDVEIFITPLFQVDLEQITLEI